MLPHMRCQGGLLAAEARYTRQLQLQQTNIEDSDADFERLGQHLRHQQYRVILFLGVPCNIN